MQKNNFYLSKAFLLGTLVITSSYHIASPLDTIYNILTALPSFIDDFVAGGPLNYYYDFVQEDLKHTQSGYEFNNLVTFGDSLSDQGSGGRKSMYIAGGYDNPLYVEYLSLAFTGKHSIPFNQGGTNYALRGSSMLRIQENRKSIKEQYDLFLDNNNGKVDPNSLYILWGGNMDLNVLVAQNAIPILLRQYNLDDPDYTMNDSPKATAGITQDLLNRGAPYVIVSNIPDGTLFPYSMMVITEQVVETIFAPLNVPYTWMITSAGRKIDYFLRNPNNEIPGEGRYFFRNNHINAMHRQLYWFVPTPLVALVYDIIAYVQDKSIAQYNHSLNQALSGVNGNIVYFDFAKLLNEIAYHYKDYHIDTVLVPTCTLGYSSRFCDTNSPEFHSQISLFSDWFHPSPQLHLMIGQTIQAILNSPVYASSIARQADHINLSRELFISNQLDYLRNQTNTKTNTPAIFVGYSGSTNKNGAFIERRTTHTNLLNIGIYNFLNPQWLIGGALSLGFGKNRPHQYFNYDFNHQNLSLFTQYVFPNNLWINLNLGWGRLSANDILRSTLIYRTMVEHKSHTKAYSFNFLFKTGIEIIKNEKQNSGPILEIGLNQFKVNAYQETGKEFLAMKYGQYTYTKNHAALGWYYHNQAFEIGSHPVQISLETTFNHALGNNKFKIPASLITAPTMFKRDIKNLNKQWLTAKITGHIHLGKANYLSSSLSYTTDFKRNKNQSYTIGFNHQF